MKGISSFMFLWIRIFLLYIGIPKWETAYTLCPIRLIAIRGVYQNHKAINIFQHSIYLLHELGLLLGRAELEELLYDVVAEDVGHEGVRARRDLLKDEALLLRRGALQLLLDEAAPVLVLAELHHVRLQLAQRDVRVAVVPAKRRKGLIS